MELFTQGGTILIAIFALSFIAWVLIVYRWQVVRHETKTRLAHAEQTLQAMRENHVAGSVGDHHVVRLLVEGSRVRMKGRRSIVAREVHELRGAFPFIVACGAAMPLLGLLGTIDGMMDTFGALGGTSADDVGSAMSDGVSRALITTQAGLLSALPVVLACGILRSRLRRYGDHLHLMMNRAAVIQEESSANV